VTRGGDQHHLVFCGSIGYGGSSNMALFDICNMFVPASNWLHNHSVFEAHISLYSIPLPLAYSTITYCVTRNAGPFRIPVLLWFTVYSRQNAGNSVIEICSTKVKNCKCGSHRMTGFWGFSPSPDVFGSRNMMLRKLDMFPSLPKHILKVHNTEIRVSSGIRTHDHSVRASEDSSCLRPCGHCDRPICLLQTLYIAEQMW
jgi:hypothetical protein